MNAQRRAPRFMKISQVKNALSRVVNGVHHDGTRVVIERNGVPIAAIVSFSDLRKLVHYERSNRDQEVEELFAVMDRAREAFKDVPIEEIERETDRAIAEIRAKDRAVRASLAATG